MIDLDDDALKVALENGELKFNERPWPLLSLCSVAIYFTVKGGDKNIVALTRHINDTRNSRSWRMD